MINFLEVLFALDASSDVVNRRCLRAGLLLSVFYTLALFVAVRLNEAVHIWISIWIPFTDLTAVHLDYVSSIVNELVARDEPSRSLFASHLFAMNLSILLTTIFGMYALSLVRLTSRPLTLLRRRTEMSAKYSAVQSYFAVLVLVSLLPYLPEMLLANPQHSNADLFMDWALKSDLAVGAWTVISSVAFATLTFHIVRTLVWILLWGISQFSDRTFAILWR